MEKAQTDAVITEESLAALRARIGIKIPAKAWNEYATRDAIWHFAEGFGDDNPLWRDAQYAGDSCWGTIIAPPTYLYSCSSAGGGGGHGLAGIFGLWARDIWEWFQPVKVGDRVHATTHLAAVIEKQSRYAGRMIEQVQESDFYDDNEGLFGIRRQSIMRIERGRAREKGKYAEVKKYRYSDEEMEAIEEAYLKERRRGAETRYWEDVNVGDEVGPMLKGPMTITSMVTWLMGWGSPLCKTDRIAHLYMHAHPRARFIDPETNAPDFPEAAHWTDSLARRSGLPGAYDIGGQRVSWMAHLMTDWMGDEGFLRKLEVQLRRPNLVGDATWCRGRVTDKRVNDGAYLVECDIWGDNQRGERTTIGFAVVLLPSKVGGPVEIPTKVAV